MIDVKLEDFEKHRNMLSMYAKGLLFNFRPSGFKDGELNDIIKDIVQDTYLAFHKYSKTSYVSEQHLCNFLKLCLYRIYQNYISNKRGSYESYKDSNITDKKMSENESFVCELNENFDEIKYFLSNLDDDERKIVLKLLEGYTHDEISKEMNIHTRTVGQHMVRIRKKYLGEVVKKDSKKQIYQINLKDNKIIKLWNSGIEAATTLNLSASAISNCCKGLNYRLSHGGFKWKYKEEYESTGI